MSRLILILLILSLQTFNVSSLAGGFGSPSSKSSSKSTSKITPLRSSALIYDKIINLHPSEYLKNDVYVVNTSPENLKKSPDHGQFWYVGKLISQTPSPPSSFPKQILTVIYSHAKKLNPTSLSSTHLKIYLALGDTELDVVRNVQPLLPISVSSEEVEFEVGFNPEIYTGDEVAKGGLRVKRSWNGEFIKEAFDVNLKAPGEVGM